MAKKVSNTSTLKVNSSAGSITNSFDINNKQLLLLTGLVFVMYVVYSFFSSGFYQHDEIGHYFNMLQFWKDPNAILGNSPKTGYKLIYVLPALLGNKFLVFFNAALAAMACWMVFKILKQINSGFALLGFFMLAMQPYWIQLSFRNYADPFSGVVLVSALYFHYREKFIWSALIMSFSGIIRQEFLLMLLPYGLWLMYSKKWIPMFLLAVFPFLNNLWGFLATGEALYLITSSSATASRYADEWPRQGFDHYFKMGITIWGVVQMSLFIVYLATLISERTKNFNRDAYDKENPVMADKKSKSSLFIFASFAIYFLIHCLFNWESVKFGASTGGNLRYMTAVSPCIALLAAIGLDRLKHVINKMPVYIIMGLYIVVVGLFLSFKNNNIRFTEEKDYLPFAFTALYMVLILAFNKSKQLTMAAFLVSLLFVLFTVRPFKLTPEDLTMEKITNSVINKRYVEQNRPILVNHNLFKYFYDKKKKGVYENLMFMDSLTLQTAPIGSIVIWESHYGYRPKLYKNAVNVDYFQRRPNAYALQQNHISTDQRFQAVVFEKTAMQ